MQLSSSTATRSPPARPIPSRALAPHPAVPRLAESQFPAQALHRDPVMVEGGRSAHGASYIKHRPLRSCREAGLAGGGGHPLEVRLELERGEAGPEPALHQRAAHQPQSGLASTVPHAVHEAFVVVAPDGPHPVGYVVTEEPADAFLLTGSRTRWPARRGLAASVSGDLTEAGTLIAQRLKEAFGPHQP